MVNGDLLSAGAFGQRLGKHPRVRLPEKPARSVLGPELSASQNTLYRP
jgi:hypothetical protein